MLLGRRPIDADRGETEVAGEASPGRRVVNRDEGPRQKILRGVPESEPFQVLHQRRVLVLKSGQEQKAELLREVAGLAAWVVRQAEQGREIQARDGQNVEPLVFVRAQNGSARYQQPPDTALSRQRPP